MIAVVAFVVCLLSGGLLINSLTNPNSRVRDAPLLWMVAYLISFVVFLVAL